MRPRFAAMLVLLALCALLSSGVLHTVSVRAEDETADAAVTVISSSFYRSSTGALHTVGEVENRTGGPVTLVKINVTYYDEAGAAVMTDFGFTFVETLLPGETSPFDVVTLRGSPAAVRFETSVESTPTRTVLQRGLEATVTSAATSSTGTLHVVGELRNTGDTTARYVKIIVALYDEAGIVIRSEFGYSAREQIEAGSTAPFDVLIPAAPPYATYKVWVNGDAA